MAEQPSDKSGNDVHYRVVVDGHEEKRGQEVVWSTPIEVDEEPPPPPPPPPSAEE